MATREGGLEVISEYTPENGLLRDIDSSNDVHSVGMSDYVIKKSPAVLQSLVGSCMGVAVYDPLKKIGGLAHILRPSNGKEKTDKPKKYAETCIPLMLEDMEKLGADRALVRAKIAGGAKMFSHNGDSEFLNVGDKNIDAVVRVLKDERVGVAASDVSGSTGRALEFYTESGTLLVRSKHGTKEL